MRIETQYASWLLGALLGACVSVGCAPDPAPEFAFESDRAVPGGPTLTPGRTLRYRLHWSAATSNVPDELDTAGAIALAGGLELEGRLALQAIETHDDGMLVAAWLDDLSHASISINGMASPLEVAALVDHRVFLLVQADGHVPRMWFSPETTGFAGHVLGGIVERLDFRAVDPGGAPTRVRSGQGLAQVRYVETDPGRVLRTIERLVRFDGVPGVEPEGPRISGTAVIEHDEDRVPRRFVVTEHVALARDGWRFDASESFSLDREAIVDDDVLVTMPDLEALDSRDPLDAPDHAAIERMSAQQMAESMTPGEMRAAVRAMDGGYVPYQGLISKVAGLLRGWPEAAWELLDAGKEARTTQGRQLVFDMLVAGGTAEAQEVMRALVADPLASAWDDLPVLVGRFGFLTAPTPTSVAFVLELEAQARADGRLELADALLYPMGALVRTIEDDDPWTASQLHLRLIDVLERGGEVDTLLGAVAGLGNGGRRSDRTRLVPLLQHEDPLVRGYAAGSLRRMSSPEVIEALMRTLRDPDRFVASQALHALDRSLLGPHESILLASAAILEEHHPDIEGILADALGTRVELDLSVPIALRAIAERTQDARLRHRIEQILAHEAASRTAVGPR